MRIQVLENEINVTARNEKTYKINYGSIQINDAGFQAVDNVIDTVYRDVGDGEEVFVEGGVEAKMIARKLEDKLNREVILLSK